MLIIHMGSRPDPSQEPQLSSCSPSGRLARGRGPGAAVDSPVSLLGRCKAKRQAESASWYSPLQEPHIIIARSCNMVQEAVSLPP